MTKLSKELKKYAPWAIVTGASSGIGEEFALQIADAAGLDAQHLALAGDELSTAPEIGVDLQPIAQVAHGLGEREEAHGRDFTTPDLNVPGCVPGDRASGRIRCSRRVLAGR